jgi:hypothetical protein
MITDTGFENGTALAKASVSDGNSFDVKTPAQGFYFGGFFKGFFI